MAGMRELFSQTDEIYTTPRIPIMVNMTSDSNSHQEQKAQEISIQSSQSLNHVFSDNRHPIILDEDTDEDEENQIIETEEDEVGCVIYYLFLYHLKFHFEELMLLLQGHSGKIENKIIQTGLVAMRSENTKTFVCSCCWIEWALIAMHFCFEEVGAEALDTFDTSCFSGNLRWDEGENSRNCYQIPDGNNFKVRGENYFKDKSKVATWNIWNMVMYISSSSCSRKRLEKILSSCILVKVPAGNFLTKLVSVDWLKSTKRMDHVVRRPGCAAQVSWIIKRNIMDILEKTCLT